jgi:GNAT superfamily N-acetyltransferase
MDRIEIRAIEKTDVEATVQMWRRSREGVQPALEARLNYSPEDDLKFFTDTLMSECNVWLAISNKRPVGLLAINGDSVEQLYIEPIDQRRGVGTVLLDLAKEKSPARLQLHTHQANTEAREFYENRGFRAVQFGVSPAPENEPDVRYEWDGAGSEHPA